MAKKKISSGIPKPGIDKTVDNEFDLTENIISTVHEPLLILDKNLSVINASSSFFDFFKLNSTDTIGTLIFDLGNNDWNIPALRELLEIILPVKKIIHNYEIEHEFSVIGKKTMLLNVQQIQKADRDEKKIVVAIADITSMKCSDKVLNTSEDEFRIITENSPDAIFIVDGQGKYEYINSKVVQMLGYSQKEMLMMTIADISPKERLEEYLKILQHTLQEGSYFTEIQLIKKDGSLLSTDFNSVLLPNGFVYASCRDITNRKLIEAQLKKNEERFRITAENLTDGIYIWDIKEKLDWFGDIDGLMGYPPGGYPRTIEGWVSTIHPEDKVRVLDALEHHLKNKGPYYAEYRTRKNDGEFMWWSARGTALRDDNGEPYKMIGSVTDITERKHFEETLSESYQLIEGIINSIPVRVFWKDKNLVYLGCNTLFAHDAGFENPKEIIGKDDYQMGWHNQADLYREDDRNVMESGSSKLLIEEPQTTPDGNIITLLTSKIPLKNSNGDIIGVLGIYIDITDRKQIELKLTDALTEAQQFRHMLDHVSSFIYMKDLQSRYIYANKATLELFGCSAEELVGSDDSRFFKPVDIKRIKEVDARVFKGEKTTEEINVTDAKGIRQVYWQTKSPIYLETDTNTIFGLLGISTDITERKHAEHALEAEKEQLSITLRSIGDGVITTNLQDIVVMVNRAAEEITGFNQSELAGKPITELCKIISLDNVNSDDKQVQKTLIEKIKKSAFNDLHDEMIVIVAKESKKKMVAISCVELKDQNSSSRGFVYVMRDITELLKIEKQLFLSQKMESVGQLAAGIAHEINTPMQYIGDNTIFLKDSVTTISKFIDGITELVKSAPESTGPEYLAQGLKKLESDMDIQFLLQEIPIAIQQTQAGIQHVSKIVLAMKDFAHPSAKEKSNVNINNGIEVTATISKNEWKYSSDLELKLDPDLPEVFCVLDEINQVILNMIVNANDAIKDRYKNEPAKKGKILIETGSNDDFVFVKITDSGTGIKKEHTARVFDHFFTTKEVGKGTGQGLSIAHEIIFNKHHGNISIDSVLGEGTTFTINLPRIKVE